MSITCPSCLTNNEDTATSCVACGTPLQAENHESHSSGSIHHLPPQTYLKGNRYQIEKTLGEGGFGITYQGIDCQTSKTIAIKELWPEKSVREGLSITWSYNITPQERKQQLLKFQLEAKYQSQCQHPNICQVYDWFEENNTAYIIMQFVSGKTLYQLLQNKTSFSEAKIKKYFIEIADALAVIHNNNLLHRDIKPENILIDADDKAIIIDFGATKEFIAGQSRDMSVTLTQGYAPPEQYSYRGKRWPATDIYALCASIYELLTGQLPEASIERMQQLGNNNVDGLIPPRQLAPHLSPLLENVILTGLNIKVENRFQNAEELIEAVKGNFVSPLHKKARNFVKNNELEQAIQTYEKCLANEPNNGNVATELALVESHLDAKKAEKVANQAIKLSPEDGRGYGVLGLVLCRRSNWKQAEQNLKKATQLSPREAWIHSNLAWALGKLEKWEEAEAAVKQALSFNPNCTFSLGLQSWIAAQKQEWKNAIKGARQALFKSKQNSSHPDLAKWIYPCLLLALNNALVTKKAQDVDRCLEEYMSQLPDDSFAWGFYGWKQSYRGISQEVISSFEKATRQGKPPHWILINLGITQEHLQQTSEAVQTYQKAQQLWSKDAFCALRLGTNFAKSGQWDQAISQLENCLSLNNKLAPAYHNLGWSLFNKMKSDNHQQKSQKIIESYQSAIALYQKQSRLDLADQLKNAFLNIGINIMEV